MVPFPHHRTRYRRRTASLVFAEGSLGAQNLFISLVLPPCLLLDPLEPLPLLTASFNSLSLPPCWLLPALGPLDRLGAGYWVNWARAGTPDSRPTQPASPAAPAAPSSPAGSSPAACLRVGARGQSTQKPSHNAPQRRKFRSPRGELLEPGSDRARLVPMRVKGGPLLLGGRGGRGCREPR